MRATSLAAAGPDRRALRGQEFTYLEMILRQEHSTPTGPVTGGWSRPPTQPLTPPTANAASTAPTASTSPVSNADALPRTRPSSAIVRHPSRCSSQAHAADLENLQHRWSRGQQSGAAPRGACCFMHNPGPSVPAEP